MTGQILHKQDIIILLFSGFLLLLQPAIFIPDSYEIAVLSECLWTGHSTGIDCTQVSWNFRPPGGSILLGGLLPLFSSMVALEIICRLSILTVVWMILIIGRTFQLNVAYWIGGCWLLTAPSFREMASLIDARTLVLGFVFSAWTLTTQCSNRKQAFLCGLLIGIAALIRPEQQLAIPLLIVFMAWKKGRLALWSTLGALLCIGGWITALSVQAGRLILSPRHWEGWLLQMLEIAPLRWTQQLWGMGIWKTPIREVALKEEPPSISLGVDMISANEYLIGITDGIPVWVLGLGSIALCIGLRYKHSRTITFASILMMAPSIIANVLPQARDPFFPSSNLFPVLFVLGTAPLFMLAAFFQKGIRQHQTPAIIGLLVVSIGSGQLIQHQSISTLPTITEWNAFQDMQTVLDSIPSDESVISTFETAAVLFQSNHKWEQWPSPFEEREAEWILVSSLDDQVWTGSIPPSLEPASLWYWTSTEDQWMLLFKRNATPPSPVLQDPCSALEHTHDHEALLQTSLAKECLLQQGSKLSASQWDNIASLACHPSFITAKTETSPMCIQQDDRLAAIHSQLCQDTPLNCIDNTLRQESQHQLYEQLLSSLLHDQQSAGVTLELGCENHTIAKSLAMALHKSEPALAMYLATCSGDEALYQLYLNERLEQNGIAACSGLFSILQKGTLSSQDRIRILAHDDSLTGIVARHILNTITTD